jgi:enoyl-CoA hydratase/carnithine racemase
MTLHVERRDRVAVITLDDPERRNALSRDMVDALTGAVDALEADDGVGALVVTGAAPAFCSGADVTALTRLGATGEDPHDVRDIYAGFLRVLDCPLPTIAAVNGPAVGAGCDLAFMCDMRVASATAQFGEVFVNLGIIPGDAGSWFLPRRIGYQIAAEMTFTGRLVGADEALAKGLVLKVVPPEKLMDEAKALAAVIASKPPRAVRQAKRLLRAGEAMDLANFLEMAAANQALAHTTADHLEAVKAFVAKRKPNFKGA